MKTKHIAFMTTAILIIFFGLFYLLFDHYLSSTAKETIMAWTKGEENSIIEGNLLSSITKTQKILLSSEIIKGVAVLDGTDKRQRPLIEFGERINFEKINLDSANIQNAGLFKKYLLVTAPNNPDIKIGFSIYSVKINNLFWITSALFSVLTLIFGFSLLLVKKNEQVKIESYASKAKQAAHDLAQPIVVLNSLAMKIHENSEETIKSVIDRINAIVDDLTDKKISLKKDEVLKNTISLNNKLENLVGEKQLGTNNVLEISYESKADLSSFKIDHSYFLRVISNLLQNAIEAKALKISLGVEESEERFIFKVTDDGKGIPQNILQKLGEKGFTHGKKFGTGLGLHGAFEFVNLNHGSITIESTENIGTTIKITLPKSATQKLMLANDTQVLVLDDDVNILKAWQLKLKDVAFDKSPEFFKNTQSLNKRLEQLDKNEVFIFSDYNLNEQINGLEFIESHQLENQAALVTGQHSDAEIIKKAKSLNVQLISKQDLKNFEIELV